jgi:hypothetical protein
MSGHCPPVTRSPRNSSSFSPSRTAAQRANPPDTDRSPARGLRPLITSVNRWSASSSAWSRWLYRSSHSRPRSTDCSGSWSSPNSIGDRHDHGDQADWGRLSARPADRTVAASHRVMLDRVAGSLFIACWWNGMLGECHCSASSRPHQLRRGRTS